MKRINKLFLPLLLTLTTLSAYDKSYSFIGVQTDFSKIDKVKAPSIGLKYGLQQKNARTSFSINYGKKGVDTFQSALLQVDMGIFKNTLRNSSFKPYVGLSVGIMQHDNDAFVKEDRGLVYGVNTGLAYILNDSFDVDLGYRYLKTSSLDTIDEINAANLSLHYFY